MNNNNYFFEGVTLPRPLSKDREYELFDKLNKGDLSVVETLVLYNLRLVIYEVTRKFINIDYDKNDLISVGCIGLLNAIYTFDLKRNIEFLTYATKCVDNEILMFLRKIKKDQYVTSFEEVVFLSNDGSNIRLEDVLSSDIDLEGDYVENESYLIIQSLVEQLPLFEREIIVMRFGLYGEKRYNQEEIAEKFHFSQSYVSRIIKKIIKKLKHELEVLGVVEAKKCRVLSKNG